MVEEELTCHRCGGKMIKRDWRQDVARWVPVWECEKCGYKHWVAGYTYQFGTLSSDECIPYTGRR